MKKTAYLQSLMAIAGAMGGDVNLGWPRGDFETVTGPRSYKMKPDYIAEEQRNIRRGLKKFEYGLNHLWALNKKSADKKAAKRGWIELDPDGCKCYPPMADSDNVCCVKCQKFLQEY